MISHRQDSWIASAVTHGVLACKLHVRVAQEYASRLSRTGRSGRSGKMTTIVSDTADKNVRTPLSPCQIPVLSLSHLQSAGPG
eukprot:6196984-Pleurochrysis_carterae.AAC.1